MTDPRRSRLVAGADELPRAFAVVEPEPVEPPEPDTAERIAEAYERGRAEGADAARREAEAQFLVECDRLRRAISTAVRDLVGLRERVAEEHREEMCRLALEAASAMLRERIEADDPVASRALVQALEALPDTGTVRVRLHPDDLDSVRRDLGQEIADGRVVVTGSSDVGRGGCVVDSDAGSIDARAETASELVLETAMGTESS